MILQKLKAFRLLVDVFHLIIFLPSDQWKTITNLNVNAKVYNRYSEAKRAMSMNARDSSFQYYILLTQ